ncbi:hypothetical protein TB1_029633 [Malus domestica]
MIEARNELNLFNCELIGQARRSNKTAAWLWPDNTCRNFEDGIKHMLIIDDIFYVWIFDGLVASKILPATKSEASTGEQFYMNHIASLPSASDIN